MLCPDEWLLPIIVIVVNEKAFRIYRLKSTGWRAFIGFPGWGYEGTDCTVDYYSPDDTEYCEYTVHLDIMDGSVTFTNANGTDGDHNCTVSGVHAAIF